MHPKTRALLLGIALAAAGGLNAEPPPDVASRWAAAGAEVGWSGLDAYSRPVFRQAASPGDLPAFRIPQWRPGLLAGLPEPDQPFALEFAKSGLTDQGLAELGRFRHLRRLGLGYTAITDVGLTNLSGLELETLDLNHTAVGNPGATVLGRLRGLRVLNLFATHVTTVGFRELLALDGLQVLNLGSIRPAVTDADLEIVARLPHLTLLDLDAAKVTDGGVAALARPPELATLYLPSTHVTGLGFRQAAFPALRTLVLADDAVTDQTVAGLAGLGNLRSLSLSRTHVTDAGLAPLRSLKQLRTLSVAHTQVTPGAARELQAALTGLEIRQ